MPRAKKPTEAPPTPEPMKPAEDPAADTLGAVEFEDDGDEISPHDPDLPPPVGARAEPAEKDCPSMTDPEWTQYVLSKLTDEEKVNDKPRVAGLRRVAALLLGDITNSHLVSHQSPCPTNGHAATVRATYSFAWGGNQEDIRSFSGIADVYRDGEDYPGNAEAYFARFPSALAEKRAKGRALSEALMLDAVTAEECTDLPVSEQPSSSSQRNFIDEKCKQLDLDVMKVVNGGLPKDLRHESLDTLKMDMAKNILARIVYYQRKSRPIPDGIRGYVPDWKESAK